MLGHGEKVTGMCSPENWPSAGACATHVHRKCIGKCPHLVCNMVVKRMPLRKIAQFYLAYRLAAHLGNSVSFG